MKRKPLESRFEVHFDGWEAYLVDEFMEYPFIYGRNRVNSAETVVRVELNRIYRFGENGKAHGATTPEKGVESCYV